METEFIPHVLELFMDSALERNRIWFRRQAGQPKPWSEDPVYQNFFFCNVHRWKDKCSQWMIENVIPLNRWDLIILYRFISTYDLYKDIKDSVDYTHIPSVRKYLGERRRFGEGKMFNGCFLRNPSTSQGVVESWEAPFIQIEDIRKDEKNLQKVVSEHSMERMVKYLKRFKGIAGFMAYEYTCDLSYTKNFNPIDEMTWANPGPGAERGMSLLLTGRDDRKFSKASQEWLMYARNLFIVMKTAFSREFPDETFTMREVEHQLCEFQKYVKYRQYLHGGNRVKFRKYAGGYDD